MFEAARVLKNRNIRLPALTRLGLYDARDPDKDRRVYLNLYHEQFLYLSPRPKTGDDYRYLDHIKVDNGRYIRLPGPDPKRRQPDNKDVTVPTHLLQAFNRKKLDPMKPFTRRSGYAIGDDGFEAFTDAMSRVEPKPDRLKDFETGFTRAYFYIDDFRTLVEDHEVFLLTESQFHALVDAALEAYDAPPPHDGLV